MARRVVSNIQRSLQRTHDHMIPGTTNNRILQTSCITAYRPITGSTKSSVHLYQTSATRTAVVDAIIREPKNVKIFQTEPLGSIKTNTAFNIITKPAGTHYKSGAVKNKPEINRLGRLRALMLVCIFIYCGGQLSSLGARMLHDYEIFELPEDDDDN